MTHVHYKFSSKLSYDTVLFDGPHVTLTDLKRQIMGREKLRAADCDLQITNAQTKEEYTDDEGLISKGSSVIVRRIPIIGGKASSSSKTNISERSDVLFPHSYGVSRAMRDQSSTKALSFFSMMQKANLADSDVSEEDKIKVMINQSSLNLNTKLCTPLPENYTCYRCRNTGHHIRNCPMSGQDKNFQGAPKIKKSTGIPNSLLVEVNDPSVKGAMLTNCGRYAIPAIDAEAYAIGKKEKSPFISQENPKSEDKEEPIPAQFLCLICHDLLGDAVVIPCCGCSYCDECIRSALLDSEDHVCPTCGQSDVSPDTLVANKFLRQAVNNFRKEQGCTKSLRKGCQKDPLLNPPKGGKSPPVPQSSDVPPEATVAASAENSPNTSLQPTEGQGEISNNEAYAVGKKENSPFISQEKHNSEGKEEPIPAEFICLICHDLLGDAVVIPCCGYSYCDDCIRSALLDSEDHVCPTCGQSDVSPDTLVANKFLRQAVNNFRKEQGCTKSLRKGCQKDPPLNPPKGGKSPPVPQSSDVPPEATVAASAENSSNTSLQPTEGQGEISNNGNEGKADDESAAVILSLLVSDKDPSDAPEQLEPQVIQTEEQLQTACVNQRNPSSDSALSLSGSSNPWSSSCTSSGRPSGSLTYSNTEQHLGTASSPFPSYTSTLSPLFPSTPVHTFIPAHQPHYGYPPGYALTTPIWKLPAPRGAPIPSLCSSTSTPSGPVLGPKEWHRYQTKKHDRSPQRHFYSHSNPKPSNSKSSRSYSRSSSRSASRSRSRSRPRSPYSSHRDFHSHSNPSTSYGYKRPHSLTPSSSSSSRGGHSRFKSSSHHRKSRHHSKRSSSSGRSSRRRSKAGGASYAQRGDDMSSLHLDRQRYLQWKTEYQEWYDKQFSSFINHFRQMPLPPPPPPPPFDPQDSFCPPPQSRPPARMEGRSPPSETSSSSHSSPSHSSSDARSPASHHSSDSCLPYKATDGYFSPSQSSSDSRSAICEDQVQPKKFSGSCLEKSRSGALMKNSEDANLQENREDQQVESNQLNHELKEKKAKGGRAKAPSDYLNSTGDLKLDRKRRHDEPKICKDRSPVQLKGTFDAASESVQQPRIKDEPNHERKANERNHLTREQSSKRGQSSDSRRAAERKDKKSSKDPEPERGEQPGGSNVPESRSEGNKMRKWEKTEKESDSTQKCKGPTTKTAEPQNHDRKSVKPPDGKKQKLEKESKTWSLTETNVWEGGVKVIPQKKISININLDGKRTEDRDGQQHSNRVDICRQEVKEQTDDGEKKLNKDQTETEQKRSGPGNRTTEKPACLLEDVKEISNKDTSRVHELEKTTQEKEEVDLWHCALSGVEDKEEDDGVMGKEERDKIMKSSQNKGSSRTETSVEPRRGEHGASSSSKRSTNQSSSDGCNNTPKHDSSSCEVKGSQEKKKVVRTLKDNSQDRAPPSQNPPKQVPCSKLETECKKQTEIVGDADSRYRPRSSVSPTRSNTAGNNEERKQKSTQGGRDEDRVMRDRTRLAPSSGADGAYSRKREAERLKDSKRSKQGTREEERNRDQEDLKRNNFSSSSSSYVSRERERRDQLRGGEQGRESSRGMSSVSRSTFLPDQNIPKTHRNTSLDFTTQQNTNQLHYYSYYQHPSANCRDKNRPTRFQLSPPSLFCSDNLVESTIDLQFSNWGSNQNSRTQNREPEKAVKTRKDYKGERGTPEVVSGRGGGEGSRRENGARKLEERRRSSSDRSSSHKNDKDEKREEGREKQRIHKKERGQVSSELQEARL